jgi:hypothetical protein
MFRVSHRGEGIDDADTIEGAGEIVRSQPRAAAGSMKLGASHSPRDKRQGLQVISFGIVAGKPRMSRTGPR